MPYSVLYDSRDRVLTITIQGEVNEFSIEKCRSAAARIAKQYKCFRLLADLREAISGVSIMDLFRLPQEVVKLLSASGLMPQRFRYALVVAQDLDATSFYETVSQNRGRSARAFRDMEKAKEWLSEE